MYTLNTKYTAEKAESTFLLTRVFPSYFIKNVYQIFIKMFSALFENVDYRLLFANQGNKLPFSVCSKRTDVAVFFHFHFPYIYL